MVLAPIVEYKPSRESCNKIVVHLKAITPGFVNSVVRSVEIEVFSQKKADIWINLDFFVGACTIPVGHRHIYLSLVLPFKVAGKTGGNKLLLKC